MEINYKNLVYSQSWFFKISLVKQKKYKHFGLGHF